LILILRIKASEKKVLNMAPYLSQLHNLVEEWSPLGVRTFGDGTRLVGHLRERGVGAYLHRLFGPLSVEMIEGIEDNIRQPVNASLREFYRHHNGCMFFGRSLFVFGLRRSYDRADFDAMACNPFDIVIPTIANMSRSPSGKGVTISEYEDQSIVLMEPDGKILRVLTDPTDSVVNIWPDFPTWLMSEFKRLMVFFDAQGVSHREEVDMVPPHSVS
jgi:hypothetical protein